MQLHAHPERALRSAVELEERRIMDERLDVMVIGAGQAGLAMGYVLSGEGLRIRIVDAAHELGSSWRARWDSLRLFTPAAYSALPGLPFPAEPDHYPSKDEVAQYLSTYARVHALPVSLREGVLSVAPADGGGYRVETTRASYHAAQVVIATGGFQKPRIPAFASDLDSAVLQLHSSEYRGPGGLPDGPVLVVGGGNSGVQIAAELAAVRPAFLSVGSALARLPERFLGRSVFHWLDRFGAMDVTVESRLGRKASRREVLIGRTPRDVARAQDVKLLARAVGAAGDRILTAEGRRTRVSTVVWATGFRPDYGWLQVGVLDSGGKPLHRRGVTDAAGLYFLGLPWQHTRGSALLGWVGRDAEHLAGHIRRRAAAHGAASTRRGRGALLRTA
jgi:putative flavoprotein involved in K+ transport